MDRDSMEKLVYDSNLNYSLKTNRRTNESLMNFYLTNKTTKVQQPLTTVIFDGKDLYLNIQELFAFAKDYDLNDTLAEIEAELGDNIYLRIEGDDLATDSQVSLTDLSEHEKVMEDLTDRLLETLQTFFSNFQGGLVNKEGSKYIIQKDINQIIDLTADTIIYIMDNIDTFEVEMASLVDSISDREYTSILALTGLDEYEDNSTLEEFKEATKTELSYYVETVKTDTELSKSIVNEYRDIAQMSLEELGFENLAFSTSLEKKSTGVYEYSDSISGTLLDGYLIITSDGEDITFSLSHTATIKSLGKDYKITVPTEDVYTLVIEEPEIEFIQPTMVIALSDGEYVFDNEYATNEGTLSVVVIDGSTYLPLRFVGETFGETVGWDTNTATPYVIQDNSIINMKGVIRDGKAYIKIRDFEKLGYYLSYEESTKVVTIIK